MQKILKYLRSHKKTGPCTMTFRQNMPRKSSRVSWPLQKVDSSLLSMLCTVLLLWRKQPFFFIPIEMSLNPELNWSPELVGSSKATFYCMNVKNLSCRKHFELIWSSTLLCHSGFLPQPATQCRCSILSFFPNSLHASKLLHLPRHPSMDGKTDLF